MKNRYKIWIYAFFALVSLAYVLPLLMVVSISLSNEADISASVFGNSGFRLIPQRFSLGAYKTAFRNPEKIIDAYIVTAAQAFLGTFLSCVVLGMIAYSLSRSNFGLKKPITFLVFFTMLFGGGMIPTYIIYTRYYHLNNNFLIYILPGISGGAWNTLMVRTFFRNLPESVFESAKLDGARELTIFSRIAMPMSVPVFATVGFMMLVGKWGDWNTSLLYIRNEKLYTLQYLLQKILNEAQFLESMKQNMESGIDLSNFTAPSETLKYALCVIAAGPMMVAFPFFQKYLQKGMVVGAVKG